MGTAGVTCSIITLVLYVLCIIIVAIGLAVGAEMIEELLREFGYSSSTYYRF
jgi:hypothetical protein